MEKILKHRTNWLKSVGIFAIFAQMLANQTALGQQSLVPPIYSSNNVPALPNAGLQNNAYQNNPQLATAPTTTQRPGIFVQSFIDPTTNNIYDRYQVEETVPAAKWQQEEVVELRWVPEWTTETLRYTDTRYIPVVTYQPQIKTPNSWNVFGSPQPTWEYLPVTQYQPINEPVEKAVPIQKYIQREVKVSIPKLVQSNETRYKFEDRLRPPGAAQPMPNAVVPNGQAPLSGAVIPGGLPGMNVSYQGNNLNSYPYNSNNLVAANNNGGVPPLNANPLQTSANQAMANRNSMNRGYALRPLDSYFASQANARPGYPYSNYAAVAQTAVPPNYYTPNYAAPNYAAPYYPNPYQAYPPAAYGQPAYAMTPMANNPMPNYVSANATAPSSIFANTSATSNPAGFATAPGLGATYSNPTNSYAAGPVNYNQPNNYGQPYANPTLYSQAPAPANYNTAYPPGSAFGPSQSLIKWPSWSYNNGPLLASAPLVQNRAPGTFASNYAQPTTVGLYPSASDLSSSMGSSPFGLGILRPSTAPNNSYNYYAIQPANAGAISPYANAAQPTFYNAQGNNTGYRDPTQTGQPATFLR